jgi:signal transduction histidine kinase
MEAKQLACLWRGQPNLPAVQGDQEQLRRMLMNLIENAVNYTPVGGQISIQTALIDERVGLEVSDSGIGIAAEELPQIFDRFYRATNARSSANSGTGLGLAIVKKIVDMHAATIEVHSAAGEGTRFQIQFPAQPPY